MRYEILNDAGDVVNTVVADPEFVQANYPGKFREVVSAPVEPTAPEWDWYIDLGPLYDRFGAAKKAVLTSSDAGVKAIVADLNIRKWVDLKLQSVADGLAYVGSKVPALTPALQAQILTTPVQPDENLALRKLYFS